MVTDDEGKQAEAYTTDAYGTFGLQVVYYKVSENLQRDKIYGEDQLQVNCSCTYGGEEKEENEIKSDIINYKVIKCYKKIFKGIKKNYLFFIISALCFLFLLCCIISFIILSSRINKYVEKFSLLKTNFLNYFPKEVKVDGREKIEIVQNEAEKIVVKRKNS